MKGTFRALNNPNYRLWAAGALVSNIGTWMQRTAQDWIVLSELTNHNATAVGIVMSLQFGPQVLLLPVSGFVADRFDRRKVLFATQASMGLLALGLGLMSLTGVLQLWHVYAFALALGIASAIDAPARQTFVSDLVPEAELSNAVALNSTSFNGARLVGPAVAGMLIAHVGSGWVFLLNALSFAAVLLALRKLRVGELQHHEKAAKSSGSLVDGFRYVWARPDLKALLLMMFLIGTFGLNFPIFISTMSVTVFHGGAGQYGILSSILAIGSVTGSLLSARRENPSVPMLVAGAGVFGIAVALAAGMPDEVLFALVLVLVGVSANIFNTTVNSVVQLSTEPSMRGRVMAILLAIALGGTPLGAPLVGWAADHFGPRWSMAIGAAAGIGAAVVGWRYLRRYRQLKMRFKSGRLTVSLDGMAIGS